MLPILPLLAAAAAQALPPPAVKVPDQPALTEQIVRADAELFALVFERPCDIPSLRALIADDVEFYHDKDGVAARSAADFVKGYQEGCAAHADPAAWRSRRELVRSSLHVDPVPGYGAIQAGDHLFYERKGVAGTEKLVGKARFAQLWVLGADGRWRISRIFSFAHGPAAKD